MVRLANLVVLTAAAGLLLSGCITAPNVGDVNDAIPTAGFTLDCSINTGDETVWPDPCTALASFNPSPGKAEVDLAVNPTDPLNIVVASKDTDPKASDECVWSVAQVTKDGGKTWKTVYIGGDLENRIPELKPYQCVTDPIMVFDEDGILYYALQAYRFVGPKTTQGTPVGTAPIVGTTFQLTRSLDGGLTWEAPVLMHTADGPVMFHDYPRMLLNPNSGSVHTIWNGVGQGGINPWVVTTRDQGQTVDAPVAIVAQDAPRGTDFDSGFAATRDGTIYVTINKYPGTDAFVGEGPEEKTVFIFKSTDDARSFTEVGEAFSYVPTPRQIEGHEFRTPSFTEMTIDTTDGEFADRMYAFYPDYGTGDSDILSRFSDDRGVTWSEPVRVNANRQNDQFMMRPVAGPDGTVHVLFYDRSFDPGNYLIDAVLASSTDGGLTWENVRLTASSFDGDLGVHQNGYPFIGDYNGIRVGPDGAVWTAWGDTRTGVAEIAAARLLPNQG